MQPTKKHTSIFFITLSTSFSLCAVTVNIVTPHQPSSEIKSSVTKPTPAQITTAQKTDRRLSGARNMQKIMADAQKTQITDNNCYAHTRNLSDIDTAKIAEAMGCITATGRDFYENALNNPLGSAGKATIERRQRIIRILIENPALKEKIDESLLAIKNLEPAMHSLLSDFVKGKASSADCFNKSMTLDAIAVLGRTVLGLSIKQNLSSIRRDLLGATSHSTRSSTHSVFHRIISPAHNRTIISHAIAIGMQIGNFSLEFPLAINAHLVSVKIFSKLHSLSQIITHITMLEALCSTHGIIKDFNVGTSKDQSSANIISALNRHNIPMFPSLMRQALADLYHHEKQLAPFFISLGEIDALNACATKILASKTADNVFCFTTFVDQNTPHIKGKGIYNLLVPHAVANDLDESRPMLLTGPNAGGKTTIVKAVTQNIVMSQTFGITPGTEWTQTIFDSIECHLKTTDNLSQGLSSFASEIKTAQEIVEHAKSLKPGQKFFFGLDELFKTTNPTDGETCAYHFVKKVTAFNVFFMYATHYNGNITSLGSSDGPCINYKIDPPSKDIDGNLVYPHTISKGVNAVNVGLDMARIAGLLDDE